MPKAKKTVKTKQAISQPYLIPIKFVFDNSVRGEVTLHMASVPRVGEKITFETESDPYVVCDVAYMVAERRPGVVTTVRVR